MYINIQMFINSYFKGMDGRTERIYVVSERNPIKGFYFLKWLL